jgi:hypothetical protein
MSKTIGPQPEWMTRWIAMDREQTAWERESYFNWYHAEKWRLYDYLCYPHSGHDESLWQTRRLKG